MWASGILGFSSSPSDLTSLALVLFVDEFSHHIGNGCTGPVLDSLGLTSNRRERTYFFPQWFLHKLKNLLVLPWTQHNREKIQCVLSLVQVTCFTIDKGWSPTSNAWMLKDAATRFLYRTWEYFPGRRKKKWPGDVTAESIPGEAPGKEQPPKGL